MKKLAALLIMGVLAVSMTACGNKNSGSASQESTQQSTQSQAATVEGEPIQQTTSAAEESTGGGLDVSEGWSEEMAAIRTAVVEALGEDYWPNTMITPEMLEGTYGITSDMVEDYMGEMPMISTNVDTLLIVKAKSDKVDAVEEALNAYRDRMVSDTMQYPMNLGKIQASRIERIGDYVCFVQLGADTTEASEKGDEAVITKCQEQNDLAIEVIAQNVQQ